MTGEKYTTYRIKQKVMDKIDNFLKGNKKYRSKSHFIELAIEEKIKCEKHPGFRGSMDIGTDPYLIKIKDYIDKKFREKDMKKKK